MIRKAEVKDIKIIHKFLIEYSSKELLLPRPLTELYDHLRDFTVFENKKKEVVGCIALQFCWEDIAEIRSLAVLETSTGNKIATKLVEFAIKEATAFGTNNLFTLTYIPDFFLKFDFKKTNKKKLPLKIWSDCINCIKFPNCDETAMVKKIF